MDRNERSYGEHGQSFEWLEMKPVQLARQGSLGQDDLKKEEGKIGMTIIHDKVISRCVPLNSSSVTHSPR